VAGPVDDAHSTPADLLEDFVIAHAPGGTSAPGERPALASRR
jgi:hypothetical protein